MLRRANELLARARERIRAAREHDPHAWPRRDDDRAILVRRRRIRRADRASTRSPTDRTTRDRRGPAAPGQPRTRRPGPRRRGRPGGVSGPPRGRAARTGRRSAPARLRRGRPRAPPEAGVPNGLRTAAAWSWRLIVVHRRPLRAALRGRVRRRRRRPGHRGAAARRAAAARRGRAGAPRLAARRWRRSAMLVVGLGVVAGIITLVVERFSAGFADLADQVSQGIGQVQTFVVRTFPITQRPARRRRHASSSRRWSTTGARIASGALTTAATVGEVVTGSSCALFTCSSSSRTAARSGCGWSACSPATPAPTSTRRPGGRGAR